MVFWFGFLFLFFAIYVLFYVRVFEFPIIFYISLFIVGCMVDLDGFVDSVRKGEVVHTNYKLEFLRFFESHKRLCDEISGLKFHVLSDDSKVLIGKENFGLGIKRLNSFIIDYLHYVDELVKREDVWSRFLRLESSFFGDVEYSGFVKKSGDLSNTQEVLFTKKYIFYLRECFEVSFVMAKYLQKSLNIASREVVKNLQFVNYDGFFNNLSAYREEVANDLSNLDWSCLFDSYKKLLGYYYTYKYIVGKREDKHIVDLLGFIYGYITLDDVVRFIIRLKDGDVSEGMVRDLRGDFVVLRNSFNKVYFLVNYSLSLKNILPKSNREVLIDNTLI